MKKVEPNHGLMKRLLEVKDRILAPLAIERAALSKNDKSEVIGPSQLTPSEQEKLINALKKRTEVATADDKLLKTEYPDSNPDPDRAAQVTQKFAELFVAESLESTIIAQNSRKNWTRRAFDFMTPILIL